MEQCLDCGSVRITEEIRPSEFQYGDGVMSPAVTFATSYPVFECQDCGLCWSDGRGEEARAAAVNEYLQNRGVAQPGSARLFREQEVVSSSLTAPTNS